MDKSILNLIKQLFEDSDGYFYRWESDNLTQRGKISTMTPESLREYVSPVITFIKSRQQIVLGLRFGFTKNPIAWKTHDKREILDKAQVQVLILNSRCTSGKIVTHNTYENISLQQLHVLMWCESQNPQWTKSFLT
jgi:hypothetical protein